MLSPRFRPVTLAAFVGLIGLALSACGTSSDRSLATADDAASASQSATANAGGAASNHAAAGSGTTTDGAAPGSATTFPPAPSQATPGHSSSPDPLPPDGSAPNGATDAAEPSPVLDASVPTASAAAWDAQVGNLTDAGLSCDSRAVRCRIAEPTCPYGEVPAIVDGCYGACTAIEACPCLSPEECPQSDKYTCINSSHHCSPYLF